jgi:hypothetical protein
LRGGVEGDGCDAVGEDVAEVGERARVVEREIDGDAGEVDGEGGTGERVGEVEINDEDGVREWDMSIVNETDGERETVWINDVLIVREKLRVEEVDAEAAGKGVNTPSAQIETRKTKSDKIGMIIMARGRERQQAKLTWTFATFYRATIVCSQCLAKRSRRNVHCVTCF